MKRTLFSATISILLVVVLMVAATAAGNVISEGKVYSLVTPASAAYPDDGTKLTDGVFGTVPEGAASYYSSGAYVGFNKDDLGSDGKYVIILDLGQSYENLSEFSVGYLNETSVGVRAPKNVAFAISSDRNGTYNELGTVDTAKSDTDATASSYADTLETENAKGQFVRVTITPADYTDNEGATQTATWTFIDEISVSTAAADDTTSDSSSEDSSEETSDDSSDLTSDVSSESVPDETSADSSAEISDEASIPQTGDSGFGGFALVLLALAAIAMTAALFINVRRKEEF